MCRVGEAVRLSENSGCEIKSLLNEGKGKYNQKNFNEFSFYLSIKSFPQMAQSPCICTGCGHSASAIVDD